MEQLINDFSPGLFAMQTLLLLVIIFLMRKFAWKPILDSLNNREEDIKNAIDSAEKAKEELEKLTTDKDAMLKDARAEKEALIKSAQETSKQIVEEAKTKAQEEGAKMIESAKAAIESEKKAAINEMKSNSAKLALEIAEKLMKKELADKKAQEELLSSYLEEATV